MEILIFLLLDEDKQRLFSIECKNIESARNPREIIHEIEKIFLMIKTGLKNIKEEKLDKK